MNASSLPRCLAALLCLTLGACVTPQSLRGQFAELSPAQAQASGNTTVPVRWGGTLLSTSNDNGIACLEVLARPLDSSGRPERTREDLGRFLACQPGYLDPQSYQAGRVLTVIGYVTGVEQRKLGQGQLRYAKLKTEQVYLWQSPEDGSTVYAYDAYFDPYDYPYPYYAAPHYYQYQAPLAQPPSAQIEAGAALESTARPMPAVVHPGGLIDIR